jgi:hypothetical protein
MVVRRILSMAALALLVAVFIPVSTSVKASGPPVFPVMNTSEQLPDGVWFRNSPTLSDTNEVTGFGVYAGDSVQLICYAFGGPVGPYNDSLWYYADNLTRPLVSTTGLPNIGYLNAHYINDGMAANVPDPGVPACLPEGASAFFLPEGHTTPSTADINDLYATWAPGGCSYGGGVDNPHNGSWVSILGGWSNGRLGPIYYLMNATYDQLFHIHYILLIDPGNYQDFSTSCESSINASATLANWLSLDKNNHLVILAASATGSDAGNGLSYFYLSAIQQVNLLNQVTVCWDDNLDHETAFNLYAANGQTSLMSYPSTSCPQGY